MLECCNNNLIAFLHTVMIASTCESQYSTSVAVVGSVLFYAAWHAYVASICCMLICFMYLLCAVALHMWQTCQHIACISMLCACAGQGFSLCFCCLGGSLRPRWHSCRYLSYCKFQGHLKCYRSQSVSFSMVVIPVLLHRTE